MPWSFCCSTPDLSAVPGPPGKARPDRAGGHGRRRPGPAPAPAAGPSRGGAPGGPGPRRYGAEPPRGPGWRAEPHGLPPPVAQAAASSRRQTPLAGPPEALEPPPAYEEAPPGAGRRRVARTPGRHTKRPRRRRSATERTGRTGRTAGIVPLPQGPKGPPTWEGFCDITTRPGRGAGHHPRPAPSPGAFRPGYGTGRNPGGGLRQRVLTGSSSKARTPCASSPGWSATISTWRGRVRGGAGRRGPAWERGELRAYVLKRQVLN